MAEPVADSEATGDGSASVSSARPSHVVGIGASAGGLEALERLFQAMPTDTGMAFVIVQHLSPDFKSLMDELLARWTTMSIHRVTNKLEVEANHIYLIPPRKLMMIAQGRLLLADKEPDHGLSLPIDHFLKSLAEDCRQNSIAVILSGTGSDGSRGLEAIKAVQGLVVAQSTESSKFDGMPNSARDTGFVDLSLPPEEIGSAIVRYAQSGNDLEQLQDLETATTLDEDGLSQIFRLLRDRFNLDFSYYKLNTIVRRTERRLQLARMESVVDYAERLAADPDELDALYRDLLVGVTRFFRDSAAYRSLANEIDSLLQAKENNSEFRAWVAGCATGEEAYSLAILLHERVEACGKAIQIRIFATDVHRRSLEKAGDASYSKSALEDVSPERLERYFIREGDRFLVVPEVRQLVVFAPHNIAKDAPFTRCDLVTCRNLLIYLQPPAQKKAISLFHFGLRMDGLLFLGPSESPGDLSSEFTTRDVHWKIYSKRRDVRLPIELRLPLSAALRPMRASGLPEIPTASSRSADAVLLGTYDALLSEFMPPAVLINQRHELLQVFGDAGKYLQHQPGRVSRNVLDLLDPTLRMPVAGAIQQINSKRKSEMRLQGITIQTPRGEERVAVTVKAVTNQRLQSFDILIVITAMESARPLEATPVMAMPTEEIESLSVNTREQIEGLESELRFAQENLQATVEELETSNEELQTTNEELVASNEELQSTNEELQSVNEELYTVNAEHQRKIQELTVLTDDMDNLLASTQVHTVFLDHGLRIRKFTPGIAEIFNFVAADAGRTLDSFSHRLRRQQLAEELKQVLASGKPLEADVQHVNGRWYLMRLLPYLTRGELDGVLLTLIDISTLKRVQHDLARREFELRMIANHVPSLISYVDADLHYRYVNQCYGDFFGRQPHEIIGLKMSELHNSETFEELQVHIDQALLGRTVEFEKRFDRVDGQSFWAIVSYTPDLEDNSRVRGFFICKHLVTALKESEQRFNRAVHGTTDGIWDWNVRTGEVFYSPRYLELLGFDPDATDIVKSDIDRRVHPEDSLALQAAEQRLLRDSVPMEVEYRLKCRDGQYRWFRGRAAMEYDALNRPAYISGSLQDIHDYRTLVEGKEHQVLQRDRFLAMLSHELRNPLGAVVNGCHALQLGQPPAPLQPVIAAILRQSRHMSALLDDLLDVARITEGKIVLSSQPFDLREVLSPAIESVQPLIETRDQQIETLVPDQPVSINGDLVRLQQVASNLLSNASKYSPRHTRIQIRLTTEGAFALLQIVDQGDGIPPELLQRVFEPFEQLGRKLDRSDGGMGLGLTLAQRLIRLHGGEVFAHSEGPGQGSCFTVKLPLAKNSRAIIVADNNHRGPHAPLRIVLVEDNPDARRLLQMLLQQLDYEVAVAENGAEGLQLLTNTQPDVGIVDIGLPELDGYQVAKAVRAQTWARPPLLIALTGYGTPQDRQLALKAGFDVHLTKPLNLDELEKILRDYRPDANPLGTDQPANR